MALDYIWEKLYTAVNILATGQGTIQERLGSAYRDSLMRLRGVENEIPEEIRNDFEALEKALTREEAKGDEGTIAATMRVMEADEAAKHAETILSMYDTVAKMDPQNEYHTKAGRAGL
jgi:hypothetical protein